MAMEVVQEEMGEGNMQCTNHPYKNSTPGGICAFCLQEKLGKLVSSSFSVALFPSSSSSSSPSFRSESAGGNALQAHRIVSSSVNSHQSKGNGDCGYNGYSNARPRSRLPFVLTHRRKKKEGVAVASSDSSGIVFKRSNSTATPRRGMHFLDGNYTEDNSPYKRRFWSFLYMSKHHSTAKRSDKQSKDLNFNTSAGTHSAETSSVSNGGGVIRSREKKREDFVVVEENDESPDQAGYDRKVSRSRSVGCGSRSFSGDLFGRISNGFGDCTLRRVESQREGKPKVQHSSRNGNGQQDCIKERVRCGGIFSGFMITSSSSSSSSSSYLVSEESSNANGKAITAAAHSSSVKSNNISHGRSKSWGWALTSPMRALSKTASGKRNAAAATNKNSTPNLAAIPSLLAVSG